MISIVQTYWKRQGAWNAALQRMASLYPDMDLEIVCVADGCDCEQQIDTPWPVRIIRLPDKQEPMSPCVPLNVGVAMARGDVIVIQNAEILHEAPILEAMLAELKGLGEKGYVLAAAWCPEEDKWHCHTSRFSMADGWEIPKGSGFYFCGMMYRKFWYECGGNDEIYRHGAGWDDTDFNKRAEKAGAIFKIRDDLKVIHPKTGAKTHWPAGSFQRNRAHFLDRWQPMLNVVCVEAGNYLGRGVEYVNKLHDMVGRNILGRWRFICFTDNPGTFNPGIIVKPLPEPYLSGWWNKLALFKDEVLPEGERVLYLDLDTLIVDALDRVISYNGPFACLRDFYRPSGLGSGVMMWEAGTMGHLWDAWNADRKFPAGGDQSILEEFVQDAVRLQDLYPEIVSYKVHCETAPPPGASIVCFHGSPRPHESLQQWVKDIWKVGGVTRLKLTTDVNTKAHVLLENIRENASKAPWLCQSPAHKEVAIIVGSGPSLLDEIETVRNAQGIIFALNNAEKVLREHGITAHYHVVLDARPENVEFLKDSRAGVLLIASQCYPSLFDVPGNKVLWHPYIPGIEDVVTDGNATLIGASHTVGISCMTLAYAMGFRKELLVGFDSSYRGENGHAIPQPRTGKENWTFDVRVGEKTFKTNAAMAKQAETFPQIASALADLGVEIKVVGDGLLPYITQLMMKDNHAASI